MAGVREEKKRKTRQAILQAAVRLFGDHGYERTSIAALARAAGVGKGTIYSYFQTKSEIFLAFCEDELDHVYAEVAKKTGADATLTEQLMALFLGEFRYVTRHKDFGRLLLREMIFPKELTVERSRDLDNRYIDYLSAMCRKAQQRGELRRDVDLLFVCGHFYALYLIAVSAWYMGRLQTEDDVAQALQLLLQQSMEGLLPAGKK
ncbi:MAG: TetR/AcrR family transcriptional regulator [Desulfurivibrio sp.]|jgi:AcrR family transcriptional regulator|nr:MAG: TetR/AcrR family transcriptional regulator [Desulfurivibrio sp.]